jgi:hypothetical protein
VKTRHRILGGRQLVMLTASGQIDLASTQQAIKAMTADPAFDSTYELLLDFRDVDCALTVTDIYEIATFLGWPSPVLSTGRKIAVLIPDSMPFDNARFLELCSANRGLRLGAFWDIERAERWLDAALPDDPGAAPPAAESPPV